MIAFHLGIKPFFLWQVLRRKEHEGETGNVEAVWNLDGVLVVGVVFDVKAESANAVKWRLDIPMLVMETGNGWISVDYDLINMVHMV